MPFHLFTALYSMDVIKHIFLLFRRVCDGSRRNGCDDGSDEDAPECADCADELRHCAVRNGDGWTTRSVCRTKELGLRCGGRCEIGYQKCDEHTCVTHRQTCNGTCLRSVKVSCNTILLGLQNRSVNLVFPCTNSKSIILIFSYFFSRVRQTQKT